MCSCEYWEPGPLEIKLDSPVEHVQVEPDFIQLNEIGSSGGKSQTPLTVFGRPLPNRPESVLTIRDLREEGQFTRTFSSRFDNSGDSLCEDQS